MRIVKGLVAIAAMAAASSASVAEVITLDFEGAGDRAQVLGFYGGGADSAGNSGPDFGVTFRSSALASIDKDAGGSGNFANEPSPSTVMTFLFDATVLNYEVGFTTGLSFFYSSQDVASVMVYDGLNATGNLLGTIDVAGQFDNGCTGDPIGIFCNYTTAGLAFSGVARSIVFGGTGNKVSFDNITLGSSVPTPLPIPEPQTYALMALGLAGIAYVSRRRRARG